MQNNKTVFLIGGKGFIGNAINKILKKKFLVKVINKKNFIKFANKKCEYLINANGNSKKYISEKNFFKDFKLNVLSTVSIIEKIKFKKYIHLSTVDVYHDLTKKFKNNENSKINLDKISKYGFNKYMSEIIVMKIVKKWNILRLSGMVGDELKKNPIYDMKNNKKLYVNINSKFHFMSTTEVAKIIYKLMSKFKNKRILNLASSKNISLKEVAKILNYKIDKNNSKLPLKVYSINTHKLKKIFKVADSKKTILTFLK
jgi:nucleoside-diphosphate-sugar epimerase